MTLTREQIDAALNGEHTSCKLSIREVLEECRALMEMNETWKEQLRLTHIDWCNELNENARLREKFGLYIASRESVMISQQIAADRIGDLQKEVKALRAVVEAAEIVQNDPEAEHFSIKVLVKALEYALKEATDGKE